MLYEDLGIRHSQKLEHAFRQIETEQERSITAVQRLLEEIEEPGDTRGVLFCDYQIFRQIFLIETRRIKRMGMAEHLLLLTVRKTDRQWKGMDPERELEEGSGILEKAMRASLRTGDIATLYSAQQYAVLLPTCTYDAGLKVAKRIASNFRRAAGERRIELDYQLSGLPGAGAC